MSDIVPASGATCSYVLVVSGDSCASLATACGITATELSEYNPSSTLCSTLAVDQPICCSSGDLPVLSPQTNSDGTCYAYTVQSGDYCSLLADEYYITTDDIETYNTETWGWMGCDDLQLGATICLSTGDPPMPAVLDGAECGPQVNGTERPADWSDIASLNPCPLNACCDIWGQCGITPEFCTKSDSTTGAPGTAAAGANGCISNCGTDITNNDSPPASFMTVGYFQGSAADRACLSMTADQIPSDYTHVHYGFAEITDGTFAVDLTDATDQFELFVAQTGFKRILTFGGWTFSTDPSTYQVFREAVTSANRATLVSNVVDVVNQYDLDGVDFDWEYPGEPDIPDIPAGSDDDGANYLAFLTDLRAALPSAKSISIAAPASYWYLKAFPIGDMSSVLDYITLMAYDLHGQWDFGGAYSQDGCATGNCLRSHVNLTETQYALGMITKAGVPASKVAVGIASYARSFGMVDDSCTGPDCFFTGPDSTAEAGPCTNTAGILAEAELQLLLDTAAEGTTSWYDAASDSDMVTFDGTWAAYMSEDVKASRVELYEGYNLGGTVNWAIDLVEFVDGGGETTTTVSDTTGTATVALLTLETGTILSFTLKTFAAEPTTTVAS